MAETNPTTAMALALPQQAPASLPTRARPLRLADGTVVRAKSDWYCGWGAAGRGGLRRRGSRSAAAVWPFDPHIDEAVERA